MGIDTKREIKVEETTKFEKTASKTVEEHTSSNTEVTIKTSSETQPIIYNGYAKVETKVYNTVDNKLDEEWNNIDKQVKASNDELIGLTNNIDVEVDVTLKVNGVKPKVETVETEHNSIETRRKSNETIDAEQKTIETRRTSIEVATHDLKSVKTEDITAEFTIKSENTGVKQNGVSLETSESAKAKVDNSTKPDTVEINVEFKEVKEEITNNITQADKVIEEMPKLNGVAPEDKLPTTEQMNGHIPVAVIEKGSAMFSVEDKKDPMAGYRPIQFDPEEIKATRRGLHSIHLSVQVRF